MFATGISKDSDGVSVMLGLGLGSQFLSGNVR
jgi:hypothetical protein